MLPRDIQEALEIKYSKSNIKKYLIKESQQFQDIIEETEKLFINHINQDHPYESKTKRLKSIDISKLNNTITQVISILLLVQQDDLLTSTCGRIQHVFEHENIKDRLKTSGELIFYLYKSKFCKLFKKEQRIYYRNLFTITTELENYIEATLFPLPMFCEPETVKHNNHTGYLTYTGSMILGTGNHHNKDICLDVINKLNNTPLSLNKDVLVKLSESNPSKYLKVKDTDKLNKLKDQFNKFIQKSYLIYKLIIQKGNKFWLTHKVDKRGRIYSQGYHINYQSYDFKKAIIQLANKEKIND